MSYQSKQKSWWSAAVAALLLCAGCGSSLGSDTSASPSAGSPPAPPAAPGKFESVTAKADPVAASFGPLNVPLVAGWNPVALQVQGVTNCTVSAGAVGFAWWDGSTYQFRSLDTNELNADGGPRRGLWVFATGAANFTYTGGDDAQGNLLALKSGWNLASIASSNAISGANLTAVQNGQSVSIFSVILPQVFDAGQGAVDLASNGQLLPGRAYWIFATAPVQLSWSGAQPSPSPSPAVHKLAFTVQPATTTSQTNFSVTVQVQDSGGNPIPTATDMVTVALGTNPSNAVLGGTLTLQPSNGSVTYPNLQVSKAGQGYTLVASAPGLANVTSVPFKVGTKLAFGNPVTYPIDNGNGGSTNPQHIVLADLNKDGKLDLAVANQGSNTVSVRLGDGNGSFGAETKYATANDGPVAVVAGDFDGDTHVDLAVATTAKLSFLKNDGTGKFPNHADTNGGTGNRGMDAADIDNDNDLDVVLSDFGTDSAVVMTNNGTATFTAKTYGSGGKLQGQRALRIADLNGDGKRDLVIANFGAGFGCSSWLNTGTVGSLFPSANLTKSLPATSNGASAMAIAVGDLDGDGDNDVAVPYIDGLNSKAQVYLNSGTGTFAVGQAQTCSPDPFGALMADLNADGLLDFVSGSAFGVNNNGTGEADVFLGKGDGTLQTQVALQVTAADNVRSLAAGDLNGDNLPDLVTSPGNANVLLNQSQ